MLMNLDQWTLHKIQNLFHNNTSEYNSTFVFLVLCLQLSIFQMTYVHQRSKMNCGAWRPCFINHLFFHFWLSSTPRRNFLQFFSFLIHCCLCCGNLHGLRHKHKFVYQNCNVAMTCLPFLQIGPHDDSVEIAVTLSSPESFWVLFDITSEQSVELKWLMLKKHNIWFHSSRMKFPLVRMSATWFLVSMYLIWILVCKLIRSNNQSRATLWVLETCLIVGLLPFMIILITVSLSSNTNNKASWWEELTFERITLSKSLTTLWEGWRLWIVWRGERTSRLFFSKPPCSLWLIRVPTNCNNQIP